MTETELAAHPRMEAISQDVRARIAALIRCDLADEAAGGLALLRRFPNSETACVPPYVSAMSETDREVLLDALAHYSTIKWSHDVVREKQAHPVLGPFLRKQPLYPPGWYGGRPRKSLLKKTVVEALSDAGFARKKSEPRQPSDLIRFTHPDPHHDGYLAISFDPGFPRQMDFAFHDWMRADLAAHFEPLGERDFVPIMRELTYDHVWEGCGTNNPVCWDIITTSNLDDTVRLLLEVLERLALLAGRINALSA